MGCVGVDADNELAAGRCVCVACVGTVDDKFTRTVSTTGETGVTAGGVEASAAAGGGEDTSAGAGEAAGADTWLEGESAGESAGAAAPSVSNCTNSALVGRAATSRAQQRSITATNARSHAGSITGRFPF